MSDNRTPSPRSATWFDRLDHSTDPSTRSVINALGIALALVLLTRLPVARAWPMDSDEFGFVEQIRAHGFPMHHTLFLALGRSLGLMAGDAYRGFIVLDIIMSALALVSAWWWLRALVSPPTAAAGAVVLGCGPVFWGYGAMAGNYTAIVAVGSFLLGVAYRTRRDPAAWHPIAAAVVLAFGTGYRQDIGTFWLPVFVVILWQHRWKRAILAGAVFTVLNLAWLLPMLHDVGGWTRYRAVSAEFAYNAGYLNSVWNLGLVDAPVRYAVKLGMALLWTLGPCLLFVPRGLSRIERQENGGFLACLLALSVIPAIGSHLLVHFGVPGYAFHYVPALLALAVMGIGRASSDAAPIGALACSICSISPPLGWPRSPSSWPASSCSTPPIMISRAGVETSTCRSPGTQGSDCGRLCPTASPRSGGRPTRGSWRERASAGGADPHRRSETEGSARLGW